MKSFTDIKQAAQLSLFLPIESADMCYYRDDDTLKYENLPLLIPYHKYHKYNNRDNKKYYLPCWSVAALLAILPESCDDGKHRLALINSNPNGDTEWLCCYEDCNGNLLNECYADNPVDACYDMIIKLNKQKLS